jgi:hypothetical protein
MENNKYFEGICKRCRRAQLHFNNQCTSNVCCIILDKTFILPFELSEGDRKVMINELKNYRNGK